MEILQFHAMKVKVKVHQKKRSNRKKKRRSLCGTYIYMSVALVYKKQKFTKRTDTSKVILAEDNYCSQRCSENAVRIVPA